MRSVGSILLLIAVGCGGSGGSSGPPDANLSSSTPPATEMTCATLTPPASGTCSVTAGSTTRLIEGTVLTPTVVYHGGQVAVSAAGDITCVGCNCAQGGETVISCANGTISPGLINVHDHLGYTQDGPPAPSSERYDDRQQWRKALDGHTKADPPSGASADQIRWGELRHLMAGATSIVGEQAEPGLLRNLDKSADEGGLGLQAVLFDTFPLDDSSGNRRTSDCDYGGTPATASAVMTDSSYEPHTAEGVDTTAHNEFLCESSATYDTTAPGTSNDILLPQTSMIHTIALLAADYDTIAKAGSGIVWSPRSNISLYGVTAQIPTAMRMGINVALGTDWLPSGSMNLLRELACADGYNKTYLDGFLSDQDLWQMVTVNAAKVTKMDTHVGTIAVGATADLAVFATNSKAPFRSVIEAQPQDVVLVMRGGTALYGDDAVVSALATGCDAVPVCGAAKRVCLMSEIGETYATLSGNVGSDYPAFACGTPTNEPTCTPSRPAAVAGSTVFTGAATTGDKDGDGIPDAMDDCPTVFNPIRPMDAGKQADADGDGEGDACDPCPLDPKDACGK